MNYMDEISRMPAGEQELALARLQRAADDFKECVCGFTMPAVTTVCPKCRREV